MPPKVTMETCRDLSGIANSAGLLATRTARAPDYKRENQALAALMEELAKDPRVDMLFAKVANVARTLCDVPSAGITLIESEGDTKFLRWHAFAGPCSQVLGDLAGCESQASDSSGLHATILLLRPAERFAWAREFPLPIIEALAVPFEVRGERAALWVFTHDGKRQFDAQDAQVLARLGRIAASASRLLRSSEDAAAVAGARELQLEMQHRTSNLFSIIQSIARLSLRGAQFDEMRPKFEARIQAVARVHGRLTAGNARGVPLHDLILWEFDRDESRVHCDGTNVLLSRHQAQALVLGLHELVINARSFGALSRKDGRIHISWSLETETGERILRLNWRETGGPTVAPPKRTGFGTTLVRATFRRADFQYEPGGVECLLEMPLLESASWRDRGRA